MRKKITTSNVPISKTSIAGFLFAAFLLLPSVSFASVQITEIMYDLPGGDTGREWIEITNTGSDTVDLSTYKLLEGTTNHGLTEAGSMVLAPGASAILADDPLKFKADWPTFSGLVFNTVFSLSNSGETLSIKKGTVVEDTIAYSSALGAAGDGGTLSRSGSGFVAAMPSPGVYPGPLTPVPKVEKAVPVKNTASKSPAAQSKISATVKNTQNTASAGASEETFDPESQKQNEAVPLMVWIAGLVAILGLGVTGTVYARLSTPRISGKEETRPQEDEFQIIES
jgi:hypothetical protein